MTVISGKGALIDGRTGVGFWKLDWKSSDAKVVHSATEGATIRVPGNTDWNGVYQAYGHTPITMPGEKFWFQGSGSNDKGYYSADSGTIVDRVDIIWDIANARPIYHNCYFSANGALTASDKLTTDCDDAPAQSTYAALAPSKAMECKFGSDTAVPNVYYMMLSLIAKNAPYVSAGETYREGGNVDVAWMYRRHLADPDALPDLDDVGQLRMYVSSTTFWNIHDAIVKRVMPVYEIEGGRGGEPKIVSATIAGKSYLLPNDDADCVTNPALAKWIDYS